MTSIEEKINIDIEFFLNEINQHQNKEHIISMFIKGPPENKGFMWCESNGGPDCHWTEKESQGLKYVGNLVLDKGWDSSGYGCMMRFIQKKIEESNQDNILNPEVNDLLSEPKVPRLPSKMVIVTRREVIQDSDIDIII